MSRSRLELDGAGDSTKIDFRYQKQIDEVALLCVFCATGEYSKMYGGPCRRC